MGDKKQDKARPRRGSDLRLKAKRVAVLGTRGFPNVQGGIETHCQNLYTRLAARGCNITVFSRSPYVKKGVREYSGVAIRRLPAVTNKYIEAFLHTLIGVFAALFIRPHILHIHGIGPSFFTPLARLLGMRVVVTTHGPDYERIKWGKFSRFFLRLCERIGVTFANRIIAVSQHIARKIELRYGKNNSRMASCSGSA